MLLILFGLPGAGKTFAGELLRDEFGFHFHESDDDIPEDYRLLVAAGHVVSDERRDDYHRHLLDHIPWKKRPPVKSELPPLRGKPKRERFEGLKPIPAFRA